MKPNAPLFSTSRSTRALRCLRAPLLAFAMSGIAQAQVISDLPFEEPLFDHHAIQNDPLELEIIEEKIKDGLIVREFEFTGEVRKDADGNDEKVRIRGFFLLPETGENLPGLLWCQGGMAAARNGGIPGIYAKKGYACINITLPHKKYSSWTQWDASNPKRGNHSVYGHLQMRAITILSQDPRIDSDRIGVVGASYGGFFSTLVAGADPRVKAGASFFSGGHHDMGTNLPQFTKMPDQKAVDTWMRLIDPAWRHEKRDVPFLWALPTNDNWFYFPAVVETYKRAMSKGNRLAIVPYWTHGFPPNIDQQLFDWFDVHLMKTRDPYLQPSELSISETAEGLKATWTTDRPMKSTQLVVSPNAPADDDSPWLGQWVHRLHQPLPATLSEDGMSASAIIPVLDPARPMLVYANVFDTQDVLTSTLPMLLNPPSSADPTDAATRLFNGCPWGELDPDDMATLVGMSQAPGVSDENVAHRGDGSVRVPADANARLRKTAGRIKLFHVPHVAHRLTVAVRSEQPAKIHVAVIALPPVNWQQPAVKALMGDRPAAVVEPIVAAESTVDAGTDWTLVELVVPAPELAIEGYDLQLKLDETQEVDWWFDSVSFAPVVD